MLKLCTYTFWLRPLLSHYFDASTNPWAWVLLEKLISQLIRKFPAFYETRRCITVYTKARHYFLPWARWIQPTGSHPIPLRLILLLSMNLPYRDPYIQRSEFHVRFTMFRSFWRIRRSPRPCVTFGRSKAIPVTGVWEVEAPTSSRQSAHRWR
jgi:hypothetical protein